MPEPPSDLTLQTVSPFEIGFQQFQVLVGKPAQLVCSELELMKGKFTVKRNRGTGSRSLHRHLGDHQGSGCVVPDPFVQRRQKQHDPAGGEIVHDAGRV